MKKEWWLLLLAGALEVVWVSGLKHSTAWWHWAITAASIIFSFKVFIDVAAKLPLGTVYVLFTGLGTAGTVIAEIVLFGEPVKPLKLLFIATMAAGVLGLKLVTKDADVEAERTEGGA
ncbi:DMT family transporter [Paenibacillus ginsengihumi]|uniref:DMT family transporter n=1 Tax=Paenibacillus ginsengihumi TaxID=431596 RepID=UPI000378B3A0|nr:SMR family transporter [Paenibacillus ginsengihumi]